MKAVTHCPVHVVARAKELQETVLQITESYFYFLILFRCKCKARRIKTI